MFLDSILYYLLCIYMVLLPLIRTKVSIMGKNVPPADGILAIIIVFYMIKLILSSDSRRKFINGIKSFFTSYLSIFMSLLALVMLISISYAFDKKIALSESMRFISYIIIFFIIKYDLNVKKYVDGMINTYIGTTLIICLFGIYQYFTGYGLDEKFKNYEYAKFKIAANMDNPNNLGAFLILALFPMIMLAIYEKRKIQKLFYTALCLLILLNIVFTGSRNAILGVIIGMIVLAILYSRKLFGFLIAFGVISLFIPQIKDRLMAVTDKTQNQSRIFLWEIAKKMIKDHPLFGVGNGNYERLHDKYTDIYPQYKFYEDIKVTHNSYLKIESELGIMGGISFIGMLISSLLQVRKLIISTEDRFYKFFYTGFLASMFAFYFMNLSDNLFFVPKTTTFFWILLAISQGILIRGNGRGNKFHFITL